MPLPLSRDVTKDIRRLQAIYQEYPGQFWVLVAGSFIDRLGGALLFPFFTLYITRKFRVGMTTVGLIFVVFALSGVIGSMLGGALTDRMGRKAMLLFGLIMSALSSLAMGLIDDIGMFFIVAILVGLLAETGGPAQQAMVADLLPEEKRAQGYGILRVAFNLAVVIGPMIGGLLVAQSGSYMLLFVCDAVTSLIMAGIVYLALKETRPTSPQAEESQETMAQTFRGYLYVLRDVAFIWFWTASALMALMYIQMNTTLAVYLRDSHGILEQGFSYILALNAAMVVLFQFPITRWLNKYRPLVVMAAGTLLCAVGFVLYGFVTAYLLFLGAMVIITLGEMFVVPTSQAIVSHLAPEDMRGRYMAAYGFSWVIAWAIGPLLAGLVMDYADPRWVWYGAALAGLVAAAAFYLLERQVGRFSWAAVDQRVSIIEQLEEGEITAEEAASLLEAMEGGKLAALAPSNLGPAPREPGQSLRASYEVLRVRISDAASGAIKADLRLPLGLVNTALDAGGRLSVHLDGLDGPALRDLIARSIADASIQTMETRDERVEVSLD
jgi:MFS family permease